MMNRSVTRRFTAAAAVVAALSLAFTQPASAERPTRRSAPATEQVTVVVKLREQASLTTARRQRTRAGRQRAVVRELRDTATRTQVPVRRMLDGRRDGSVRSYTPLWSVNAVVVTATSDVIAELASRPDVESVTPDAIDIVTLGTPSAPPEPNIVQINALPVWTSGYDGSGVVVASLDTGVDASHPDLTANYRGGSNSWFDPYGQHSSAPYDANGHGTATMGAMAGGGTGGSTVGVAPGASWIAARIFDDAGNSTASAIHLAMQWVLDPDGDPATADAPAIVNNSWAFGTPGCNLEFQPDVQALRAAGIVPVFAAGNYGSGASSGVSPANYPEALSVGAVDSRNRIWSGSSRGPSSCGEPSSTYPDVVAPGVNIYSTARNGLYSLWTGTSMAAPEVSGALAALVSSQQASASTVEAALLATTVDKGAVGADNTFGLGLINVAAAYSVIAPDPTTTLTVPDTTVPDTTTSTTTTSTTTTSTTTVPDTTTSIAPSTPTSTTVPAATSTTSTTSTTTMPETTTTAAATATTVPETTSTTTTTVPATTTTSTTTLPATTTTTTTTTTTVPVPDDLIFGDGFESGSTDAWAESVQTGGTVAVSSAAALHGNSGLEATISSPGDVTVVDRTPNADTSYHARFGFDPNGVTIRNTTPHSVLTVRSESGALTAKVELRRSAGAYQIRARTLLDSGAIKSTPWTTITDAPHAIELGWTASVPASRRNGTLTLWMDGVRVSSLTKLANGAQRIDEARLGPQDVRTGVTGAEYYDDFVSTATTYIGP